MAEERFTQRTVTVVMAVIAALAFVFSFGNIWACASVFRTRSRR